MPALRPFRPAAPVLWPLGQGRAPAGRFVALVPGEEAVLIPLALPPGLRGPARLAVARRQAQDRLGTAALDLRPAPLGSGADAWGALLATDPAALARWRAALGPAARRARALIPDYLALPAAPGLWVLAAKEGRLRARLGPADGFAAEAPLAALMLAQARARSPAPRAVLLAEGALPPEVAAALEGLAVVTDPARLPEGIPAPRVLALGEAALDLRNDPGLAAQALAARLRLQAVALGLALLGVGGWAGAVAVETAGLRARAGALDAATLAAVRRDILPEGPILDLRLQIAREIERRAGAGAGPSGGLALLRRAAEGLAAAGAVPQSLTLTPAGVVAVDLTLPDFASLERVAAALAAGGLGVEVVRSASAEGGVAAGLTLTGGAP